MPDYKKININEFSYPLPEHRIAKYPLKKRDRSKLLIWKSGAIEKDLFFNLPRHLPEDSLLVFNNTRVIHARLFFRKETGAQIEIFCLEPLDPPDHETAFRQRKKNTWKCLVGNAKKWKGGTLEKKMSIGGKPIALKARLLSGEENAFIIEFSWDHEFTFAEIIKKTGVLPIPPYLKRPSETSDQQTYQTVYAKNDGSVAAPTAGLHFTKKVMSQLPKRKIVSREITLHVGAGTFQPVKSETIDEHVMHHEQVIISRKFIEELLSRPRKIIAIGTTSVRSLESLYWLGLKLEKGIITAPTPAVFQWEPYENKAVISRKKALENILKFLKEQQQDFLRFSTQIIIVPGYSFKMVGGMVTNFHQPRSTLLLLIGAFLGNDWKKVYDFALENDFRFLSYGDSNLYLK